MISDDIKTDLAKTLPAGRVVFDFNDRPEYTKDATELVFTPDALFFAETEDEIIAALKWCRRHGLPVVLRGAGTGYSGGALAVKGGLLLSTERMKNIVIDRDHRIATAGPGAITGDIMAAAERQGLFYPPDPASYLESTIGGNVAENAGGLRCKKYGVTKDYVVAVRGITADGDIVTLDNNCPFGLMDVIIGSEGTLFIVTSVTLRLIPLPSPGRTIQAVFPRAVDAAAVVAEVTAAGIVPMVMEFMDRDAIACSNQYDPGHRIEEGEAMLLFETDGRGADSDADRIKDICGTYTPSVLREASGADERETLWQTRRNLSKAVKETAHSKTAEDVCVPPSRLPELVAYVEQLRRRLRVRVNCYGHAGDGNLHVNFLGMTGSAGEAEDTQRGVAMLFEKTLALGGTLTGEHGIGITKKDFLAREFDPPTITFMRRLKAVFDQADILNPGKMFV
ncbi:MAG: FAD-binding oxidoreductase [candidate division Zixibacteria bacterium]|nr:FAD-binding oxidoreductase [candidate division Zixibacteria bacterium]